MFAAGCKGAGVTMKHERAAEDTYQPGEGVAPSQATMRAAAALMSGLQRDGLGCLIALYDPDSGAVLQLHTFQDAEILREVAAKCSERAELGGYAPLTAAQC